MGIIEPLKGKEFVFTIKWVVPAEYAFDGDIEDSLETMRSIGEAGVIDVQIQNNKHESK